MYCNLQERFGVLGENGERIGGEEEVFNPALIAIRADIFAAIA